MQKIKMAQFMLIIMLFRRNTTFQTMGKDRTREVCLNLKGLD